MKKKALLAAAILVTLGWVMDPGPARGVGAVQTVPWDVREEWLPNGLKVLLLRDSREAGRP